MGSTCGTSCCEISSVPRNFLTKEEKMEMLSEYQESLEKEAKAVKEKISQMKKED